MSCMVLEKLIFFKDISRSIRRNNFRDDQITRARVKIYCYTVYFILDFFFRRCKLFHLTKNSSDGAPADREIRKRRRTRARGERDAFRPEQRVHWTVDKTKNASLWCVSVPGTRPRISADISSPEVKKAETETLTSWVTGLRVAGDGRGRGHPPPLDQHLPERYQ